MPLISPSRIPGSALRPVMLIAVCAIFLVAGLLQNRAHTGDDLAVSYLGCQVLATGHPTDLFSFSPDNFSLISPSDTVWHSIARSTHFPGSLHPYVQTPLWARVLRPLCTSTSFSTFNTLFTALALLAFLALVLLVARAWTPCLLHPLPIALIFLILWLSTPFQYAMLLTQTHIFFLLLTLAALILAERRRPIAAGLLLALAAAVKITPAFLVLYWLLTRRLRAAASTLAFSALLLALTYLIAGSALLSAWLDTLHRISNVLLVSQNNQSFAAWVMGRVYPPDEIFDLQIYGLPTPLRLGSTLLLLACTVAGGLLDRARSATLPATERQAPLGAMLALVAATLFSPIAWTHYSIVLIAPLMLLFAQARALPDLRRSRILLALILAITLLNLPPLATDIVNGDVGRFSLLRSQFFSGILCLLALALAARYRSQSAAPATRTSAAAPSLQTTHAS